MRVLVTDSNTRSALAVTRSLGCAGHTVVTAGPFHPSLASSSRHSTGFVQYPDPASDPQGFVDNVAAAVASRRVDVLLPMTDVTTILLAERRGVLPPSCRLPFSEAKSIAMAADKAHIVALAERLGIPVPTTVRIDKGTDLPSHVNRLTFPVVIKPSRSRVRYDTGWRSYGVTYARDFSDLFQQLDRMHPAAYPILLQERVSGPGVGLFMCCDRGRIIASFSHVRLREKPPSGGVSVLSESVPLDPDAVEFGGRLLSELDWHGVAMIEFKRDEQNGKLRLMEINGRFWGSIQLAISAGVDFPSILVDLASGKQMPPIHSYQIGVKNRWFLGDLDVLLTVLTKSRETLSLPAGFPTRSRLIRDFMKLLGRNLNYEVLTLDDPAPGILEFRSWLMNR